MSRTLHQVIHGAGPTDAITSQTLLFRSWLRELGFDSEIFAHHIGEGSDRTIRPLHAWRPNPARPVLYHHSFPFPEFETLCPPDQPIWLHSHNVTPVRFFEQSDPALAQAMRQGADQLSRLKGRVQIATADSAVNAQELIEHRLPTPTVIPIAIDPALQQAQPDPATLAIFEAKGPHLLFVGRITPNKRQEDCIRLMRPLRQILPEAQLHLVGEPWHAGYSRFLDELIARHDLGDLVHRPGRVSWEALAAYYRGADFYVSMSEHEGFGKPLLESMTAGLPILAFAEPATRETLGRSGIQFSEKRLSELACLIRDLAEDPPFRERLIKNQRRNAERFSIETVKTDFIAVCEGASDIIGL